MLAQAHTTTAYSFSLCKETHIHSEHCSVIPAFNRLIINLNFKLLSLVLYAVVLIILVCNAVNTCFRLERGSWAC